MYYEGMEKEPRLSEILFGDVRASKMQDIAHKIRTSDKPVTLLDVENWVMGLITGKEERDDIIEGQD